jgi:uncharacterized protein YdeI (BOF family)
MKKTLFAVAVLLGVIAIPAQAEPNRPYHMTTVRWVVATRDNLAVDDRYVTLVGHVTRRIGDEEYWFTDGTGSVRLDSENFDLPVGARIVIGGRIDQAYLGFGHLEVDVRHWHYAPVHHPMHKAAAAAAPAPAPAAASTPPPAEPAPAPATTAPAATQPAPAEAATTNQSLTPPQETH